MTKEERLQALEMRLDGHSWTEIGKALGYTRQAVQQDMQHCISGYPRTVNCVYPVLKEIITEQYGSSISAFTRACGLPDSSLYYVLSGRGAPSIKTAEALTKTTVLSYDEMFGEVDIK